MNTGQQLITPKVLLSPNYAVAPLLAGFFSVADYQLPGSNVYLTSQRFLQSVSFPVLLLITSTQKIVLTSGIRLFIDLLLNQQVIRTLEPELISQSVNLAGTVWVLSGICAFEFQNEISLPNPYNLSVGAYGFGPETELAGTSFNQVAINFLTVGSFGRGSISYRDES